MDNGNIHIMFSSGALKYLNKNEATAITLQLVALEDGTGDIDMVKEVEVKCTRPEKKEMYFFVQAKGIAVYVDKRLKITGNIKIKKEGIWKFSFLYADGVLVPF